MKPHPLDDVRGLQEEHKSPWPTIVREHLNRTLIRTGYVSADDFDALGIPPEHSNLANAQMGAYSRMGYMEAISWKRSTKPSRKSGKIWTHKITEKGRKELSGLDAGVPLPQGMERSAGSPCRASVEPGDSPSGTGVPTPPECTSVGAPELLLFELPSRNYADPDQRAA